MNINEFTPFNDEPFWDGIEPSSEIYPLSDDAFRRLLYAKCAKNLASCDSKSINSVLKLLLGDGFRAYISDIGGMAILAVFESALSQESKAIITQAGIVPRPAGVTLYAIEYTETFFGFASDSAPFNDGTFIDSGSFYVIE